MVGGASTVVISVQSQRLGQQHVVDAVGNLLIALVDIHLKSDFTAEFEPVGNILYVYLFTALALIILILSCIHFISLSTTRSVYPAE